MENYRSRLQEQAKALQTDIDGIIDNIKDLEDTLDKLKEGKALYQRELRSIEKKLEKLTGQ